jgi:CHAD domain-containing protein
VAYAFERDEPLTAAIPRLMNEQIARARDHLAEEDVHGARKRFKETRALLRLIREPLGEQFAIENAWFRDAGRDLAAVRDADAMLEALEKLELPRGVRTKVKRALKKTRTHAPIDGLIANTLEQLVIAQARIALWSPMEDSFDTITAGLQRTYRDGRRAMKAAQSPEALHEWRKFVKTHWYHVQLLRDVWQPLMKAHANVLDELSHALGDHHDLHVLGEHAPALLDAIAARQQELEKQAFALGARIYAERPSAFVTRMRKWWSAWR